MHSKSIVSWFAVLVLILVALIALMFSSATAAVQEASRLKNRTDFLFSLIQNANATVANVFRRLEAKAIALPETSLIAYDQALLLADEATNLLRAGSSHEANSKAIQALQKFKEALRIIYESIPEQPTEAEITRERIAAIKSSIDRSYEQVHRLENLTRLAAAAGYNASLLEAKIETVKALLNKASNNLNQRDLEAALNNTAEAKVLISSLTSSVSNFATAMKIQRLQAYVAQTEERLATIRTEATLRQNSASLTALNNAEASLANAREYLEQQMINQTLSALAASKASEEQAVGYLKPTPTPTPIPTPTPNSSISPSPTNKSPNKTPSPNASTLTR